ncbi:MAG: cell division protein FtsZ, partial [Chitinophagaceae bacterium]|nr:cell division protein FtsZ [Chitinophagaceae bacterium]
VCTVMKNGGVAILGKAEVEGENRAQRAIEEALSSPLLNDDDIRGAKWILININSAEGEHECTMDELETINNHLRMQAGEDTDVIVGMGYDPTLDKKIGITMVATGFERKDPFAKPVAAPIVEAVPEKIVMTLGVETEVPVIQEPEATPVIDMQPVILEEETIDHAVEERESLVLQFELSTDITEEIVLPTVTEAPVVEPMLNFSLNEKPAVSASAGLMHKPMNIYAEAPVTAPQPQQPVQPQEPVVEESLFDMQLVEKAEEPVLAPVAQVAAFEDDTIFDDVEEQKRRAAERIQKLRNLSFNMNSSTDANGEFDAVPAYVRRNMELFGNTLTSVENFYSKYTVGKDDQNPGNISTINKFFDGKKPD